MSGKVQRIRRLLALWLPRIGLLILLVFAFPPICLPFYARYLQGVSVNPMPFILMGIFLSFELILFGLALRDKVLSILLPACQLFLVMFVKLAGGIAVIFPFAETCFVGIIIIPIACLMNKAKWIRILLIGHAFLLMEIVVLIYMVYAIYWNYAGGGPVYSRPVFHTFY